MIAVGTIALREGLLREATASAMLAVQLGVAGLLALVTFPVEKSGLPPRRFGIPIAAGVALFVASAFAVAGLDRVRAGPFIVLVFAAPVWVAVYEGVARRRSIDRMLRASIAGVICGLTVMADPWGEPLAPAGLALGLLTSLGFAGFIITLDLDPGYRSPVQSVSLALIVAALLALSFIALASSGSTEVRMSSAGAMAATVAGTCVWAWARLFSIGLSRTSPTIAAIISAAEPALVSLGAFLYLQEQLNAAEVAGGLLVVGAVTLAAASSAPTPS